LVIYNNASPQDLAFARASGNGNFEFKALAVVPVNRQVLITVSTADGNVRTTPTFYIDGVQPATVGSAGTGTGSATGTSQPVRLGRRPTSPLQMDGDVSAVMIWSRALSEAEHAALHADPFCFLEEAPFSRTFLFASTQATTEVTGTVARTLGGVTSAASGTFTAGGTNAYLVPDSDVASSNMAASGGGALWDDVNDPATEDGDYVYNTAYAANVTWTLTDTPADFGSMTTATLDIDVVVV